MGDKVDDKVGDKVSGKEINRLHPVRQRCNDGPVAKTLIEAIGYRIGLKAAQAKNAFDLMGGTDEESLRAEIRLGHDMAAAVLERTPLVAEDETTLFAQEIGRWLAAQVHEKKLPFRFWITAEPEPKALALPGGPIFVSRALLELCRGERDEMGFILAHEMAHVVRRHTLDRIVKDAALALLLRQTSGKLAASKWIGQTGHDVLRRAFSSEDEFAADAYASELISKAGGDATAGVNLLDRLEQINKLENLGRYFADHPSFPQRMAKLRATA